MYIYLFQASIRVNNVYIYTYGGCFSKTFTIHNLFLIDDEVRTQVSNKTSFTSPMADFSIIFDIVLIFWVENLLIESRCIIMLR